MSARDLIIRHEGLRLMPYKDTVGKLTIGVGRNLDDMGISPDEAMLMLDNDIARAYDYLEKYPWFTGLAEGRKAACINLMFNLGQTRFAGFKKFIAAMAAKNYVLAGDELKSSKWHGQVKIRGPEIVNLIVNEEWPV